MWKFTTNHRLPHCPETDAQRGEKVWNMMLMMQIFVLLKTIKASCFFSFASVFSFSDLKAVCVGDLHDALTLNLSLFDGWTQTTKG